MLEKLRAKPNHIKQVISLFITVILFSGIFFVWMSSRDARSSEMFVREKTVSPTEGVAAMFEGFMAGFKENLQKAPTFDQVKEQTPALEQKEAFDFSAVVVIDPSSATTTEEKAK